MQSEKFDVAVIGSGPGGCVVSTLLVQQGYRVVMLEREQFPRFHVGESLLPSSQDIWERMGFAERLQHAGHTFKYAGEFRIARSPISDDIISTTGFFNNFPRRDLGVRPYAYHVERAVFDKALQDFAVEQGVTLWENAAVTEVLFDGERATGVRLRRDGREQTLEADFIVDASGRRCLVARQLDAIEPDPEIRTSAVFGHFRGVTRDPGFRQGFFNGYFIEHGWLWLIPLAGDVMSVGVVQNEPATLSWTGDAEEVLLAAINRYQFIQERFVDAVQVGRVRRLQGLAYQTRKFTGDGWLSIGDANFFVDPLYSSGVQIAHRTGEIAAEVIDAFLRSGRDRRALRRYEKYIHKYRRTVFGPMRALYRLMRNYECIDAYVRSTGLWCKNFNNWFLRRANCWGSGYFDRYVWVIRIMELFANAFARWAPYFFRLRGDDGWKAYERNPYRGEPLVIPKDAELLERRGDDQNGQFQAMTLRQQHDRASQLAGG
jgi:halogenation protein CepH